MPFECCPLWKGASKTRLLCLKTVKGWFSSRNQEVCTHRAHISTAPPGWTHQNTFWNATPCSGISIRNSYPTRKLSIPSLQELYPHQILIFKNLGVFWSSCTTSCPETESCRGQHGENRGSMCMIPYQSKGLLNHMESYCGFSVHNWNQASVN